MDDSMDYRQMPLSVLLRNREVFELFDAEFARGTWLDVTALLGSDCTIVDLYQDGTIPSEILDEIMKKLDS